MAAMYRETASSKGFPACAACRALLDTTTTRPAEVFSLSPPARAPLKHETIDATLKARQPVLAKVFINRVITHWVLVVGKEGAEYVVQETLGGGGKPELLSRYSSGVHAIRIRKTSD